MRIFAYDGPLNQFMMKLVDCFYISLLWLIASIPIVTAGASTVALYFTVNKVVRQEEGGVWKTFWRAFFRDFWQATGIWIILVLFYTASLASYSAIRGMGLGGVSKGFLITAVLLVTLWTQYWYPYLSRFEDTTRTLWRNTLVMLLLDFFRSVKLLVLLILCFIVAVMAFVYAPFLLLLLPAVYVFVGNRTVDKVFAKYIPATETENAEETEEETEEND